MDELVKMLLSPTFWFGSVVVGIVINLVSPGIGAGVAKISRSYADKRRKKLERRDKFHHTIAVDIRTNTRMLVVVVAAEQRARSQAVLLAVLALTAVVMSALPRNLGLTSDLPKLVVLSFSLFCLVPATIFLMLCARSIGNALLQQSILRQSLHGTKLEEAEAMGKVEDTAKAAVMDAPHAARASLTEVHAKPNGADKL